VPAIVLVPGNVYGPGQFPDYPLPAIITDLLQEKKIEGLSEVETTWFHTEEVSKALVHLLLAGENGSSYTLSRDAGGGLSEKDLLAQISILLGKSSAYLKNEESFRVKSPDEGSFGLESVRDLGWKPDKDPGQLLAKTVRWYQENDYWWKTVQSGEYLNFYRDRSSQKLSGAE